ncbi:Hypothetical predicted protein [Marmota monax]|uniref:Uncharacterized protein n=1 Tax=Marmota monax TaxID=9995 RepID=A0A5E4AHG8_MARMO|nr:hypothetical protein GHT09_003547 [Marmota monax]VTJ55902.1 Hypothetical predicted protein [Marmota monax]
MDHLSIIDVPTGLGVSRNLDGPPDGGKNGGVHCPPSPQASRAPKAAVPWKPCARDGSPQELTEEGNDFENRSD